MQDTGADFTNTFRRLATVPLPPADAQPSQLASNGHAAPRPAGHPGASGAAAGGEREADGSGSSGGGGASAETAAAAATGEQRAAVRRAGLLPAEGWTVRWGPMVPVQTGLACGMLSKERVLWRS